MLLLRFLRDEQGATLVEYGLFTSVFTLVALAAFLGLQTALSNAAASQQTAYERQALTPAFKAQIAGQPYTQQYCDPVVLSCP